jgi:hypothetical protein
MKFIYKISTNFHEYFSEFSKYQGKIDKELELEVESDIDVFGDNDAIGMFYPLFGKFGIDRKHEIILDYRDSELRIEKGQNSLDKFVRYIKATGNIPEKPEFLKDLELAKKTLKGDIQIRVSHVIKKQQPEKKKEVLNYNPRYDVVDEDIEKHDIYFYDCNFEFAYDALNKLGLGNDILGTYDYGCDFYFELGAESGIDGIAKGNIYQFKPDLPYDDENIMLELEVVDKIYSKPLLNEVDVYFDFTKNNDFEKLKDYCLRMFNKHIKEE